MVYLVFLSFVSVGLFFLNFDGFIAPVSGRSMFLMKMIMSSWKTTMLFTVGRLWIGHFFIFSPLLILPTS